ALCIAFVSAPLIAWRTGGRYYSTRESPRASTRDRAEYIASTPTDSCCICGNRFEPEDHAYCPAYEGTICSLCCTLDSRCRDACKPRTRLEVRLQTLANWLLPEELSPHSKLRLLQCLLLYSMLAGLTGVFIGVIYYQDFLASADQLALV